MPRRKTRRGRPPLPIPEPIPNTPENVAKSVLNTPPKKADEWQYLKDDKAGKLK